MSTRKTELFSTLILSNPPSCEERSKDILVAGNYVNSRDTAERMLGSSSLSSREALTGKFLSLKSLCQIFCQQINFKMPWRLWGYCESQVMKLLKSIKSKFRFAFYLNFPNEIISNCKGKQIIVFRPAIFMILNPQSENIWKIFDEDTIHKILYISIFSDFRNFL